jgi:oxygen-independent coproporphyrinogen-3 oxidase
MDPARLDQRLPRYTSYPTAPHFSEAIGAEDAEAALAALPAGTPASLYIHVPFCRQLCWYCGCHTTAVSTDRPLLAYTETLIEEIGLIAARAPALEIRHLHWGGGTPTILPPAALLRITEALARAFRFAPDAEIAFEIDPRRLDRGTIEALAAIRPTRASLGVQDFNPEVQQAIGRPQSYRVTAEAAEALRRIGVGSINIDLVYGLPHQSEARLAATLSQVLRLAPDRIAAFGYAHVPWMKRHQALIAEEALPGIEARFRLYQLIHATLTAHGYEPVGLDHFARPTDALAEAARTHRLRRNFQGYTTDDAPVLIGLGASAISSLPALYWQNAPRVPTWSEQVKKGLLPVARGIALSTEDRLRRAVIERIMCADTADLAALAAEHGLPLARLAGAFPALERFRAEGLIAWDGRTLAPNLPAARPYLRLIAAAFDTYLAAGAARHSVAI